MQCNVTRAAVKPALFWERFDFGLLSAISWCYLQSARETNEQRLEKKQTFLKKGLLAVPGHSNIINNEYFRRTEVLISKQTCWENQYGSIIFPLKVDKNWDHTCIFHKYVTYMSFFFKSVSNLYNKNRTEIMFKKKVNTKNSL